MLVSFLALSLAHAEDNAEPKFPVIKPSGVIFARYSYDLTDGSDGYNTFAVDRVYLRTDAQIAKDWGARVTLDADQMKPVELGDGSELTVDTKYRVFVKHAWLEYKGLGPVKIRGGMIDTPYAPFYDQFTANRYIVKSFADNNKILDTADLGVSLMGSHAKGLVDWNAVLINGEGYGKIELDAGKTAQARLTIDPLAPGGDKNLPITGFVSYGGHPSTKTPTLVYAGAVGFQMPRLCAWAEVMGKSENEVSGFGYSVTLNPRLPKYAGLYARYDHWDPDSKTDNDGTTLLVAGLDKDFLEKVSLAVTYERSWVDGASDTPAHGVVVHAQAGF